jgi:hypothetical protein
VYVPSTPLLTRHQVQITACLRRINSLELNGAWALTNHLLLAGESAFQGSSNETATNNVTTTYRDAHRQASLGLGYYQAPTERSPWYLAALGGVGFASVDLHSIDFEVVSVYLPFPLPYVSGHYEVQYFR